jgi:hypothetical protein
MIVIVSFAYFLSLSLPSEANMYPFVFKSFHLFFFFEVGYLIYIYYLSPFYNLLNYVINKFLLVQIWNVK